MNEAPGPVEDTPHVTVLTKPRRRAALGFIFATALMDIIALGIMIPVLPNLVKEMVGGDIATATHMTGLFALSWGVMQFFFSPIQGMLSDRFGRRPVLLISIFGLSIDYLFMAFAPTLAWLFVGRLINGMTAASFSTAGAYIADISAPEDRAKNFGVIGAAFGVGFIIGPAIGGVLGEIDLRLPFYVAAGMGMINWLYGYFILPESLPPERRQKKFLWKKANPVGSFKLLSAHPELLGLSGVFFLFQLAHNVFPSIFVLYVGHRFGWGTSQAGLMMMATGAATVAVQAFLIGPAVKKLGERGALIVGLVSAMAGFLIYGLAPTGLLYLVGVPVFALAGLISPGIQGLMTRRVLPQEQGQLQGANSGMMGISAILGPPMFTGIFAWAVNHTGFELQGLPILIAALLISASLALALRVAKAPAAAERSPA